MQIGLSTASFYPLETEKALKMVGESGIGLTELFFNAESELEIGFLKELIKIKEYYGINIVSIHPTMSLAESFMLFSAYERRKTEGLEAFRYYGEICEMLGARYVILHGGKPNGILDDRQYCERFCEIANACGQNGGILLQENVAKYRAGSLDFLKMMKAELKDEARFCLDIKQCKRGGYSPFDVLDALKDSIKHIHISDNNAEKDCMLPGTGTFDFDLFFTLAEKAGYKGDSVIEVYKDAYADFGGLITKSKQFINIINKG